MNHVKNQKHKGSIAFNLNIQGNGESMSLNERMFSPFSLTALCFFLFGFFFAADDAAVYQSLTDYILTEEKLVESNFPVQHPEKPGCAAFFADNKKCSTDRK